MTSRSHTHVRDHMPKENLCLRIRADLRERMDEVRNRHPYSPSITAIVERGLILALNELDRMDEVSEVLFDTRGNP